jgi:hypothetical protein
MNKTCFLLFIHSEIYFFRWGKGGQGWEKGEDYPPVLPSFIYIIDEQIDSGIGNRKK